MGLILVRELRSHILHKVAKKKKKKKLFLSLFSIYRYFSKSFGKYRSGIFQIQTEVVIRD